MLTLTLHRIRVRNMGFTFLADELESLEIESRSAICSSADKKRIAIFNECRLTGFDKLQRSIQIHLKNSSRKLTLLISIITVTICIIACIGSQGAEQQLQKQVLQSNKHLASEMNTVEDLTHSVSDLSVQISQLNGHIENNRESIYTMKAKLESLESE